MSNREYEQEDLISVKMVVFIALALVAAIGVVSFVIALIAMLFGAELMTAWIVTMEIYIVVYVLFGLVICAERTRAAPQS